MKTIREMTERELDEEILYRFKLLSEEEKGELIARLSELATVQAGAAFVPKKGV